MYGANMPNGMNGRDSQRRTLGNAAQIPMGEGRLFVVDGVSIAVFRSRRGEVFATQASCPHRDGPLCDGIIGGGVLVCPLHAYKFDLATGSPIDNECDALKTYPVSLTENGEILLSTARA